MTIAYLKRALKAITISMDAAASLRKAAGLITGRNTWHCSSDYLKSATASLQSDGVSIAVSGVVASARDSFQR